MHLKSVAATVTVGMLLTACQSKPPASEAETKPPETQPESPATKAEKAREKRTLLPERNPVGRTIEIPAGTVLQVRIDETLSTVRNKAGDSFPASLAQPVVVGGKEVLPVGTRFTGHVTTSDASGRLKGRAVIGVTLDSFESRGASHAISTSLDTKASESHKKRNIELIGGGAGLGALIGGIAGGGRGAAIGAGAGAAAGTAGEVATGKKEVAIPAETVFSFTLKAPVAVKE